MKRVFQILIFLGLIHQVLIAQSIVLGPKLNAQLEHRILYEDAAEIIVLSYDKNQFALEGRFEMIYIDAQTLKTKHRSSLNYIGDFSPKIKLKDRTTAPQVFVFGQKVYAISKKNQQYYLMEIKRAGKFQSTSINLSDYFKSKETSIIQIKYSSDRSKLVLFSLKGDPDAPKRMPHLARMQKGTALVLGEGLELLYSYHFNSKQHLVDYGLDDDGSLFICTGIIDQEAFRKISCIQVKDGRVLHKVSSDLSRINSIKVENLDNELLLFHRQAFKMEVVDGRMYLIASDIIGDETFVLEILHWGEERV